MNAPLNLILSPKVKTSRYLTSVFLQQITKLVFFPVNLWQILCKQSKAPAIQALQSENDCHRNAKTGVFFPKLPMALSSIRSRTVTTQGISLCQQYPPLT